MCYFGLNEALGHPAPDNNSDPLSKYHLHANVSFTSDLCESVDYIAI